MATHAKAKKAVVARDTRVSGCMLEDALVSGLVSTGTDVLLLGMVPTPVLAYVAKALGADVGFMLTASIIRPNITASKCSTAIAYPTPTQTKMLWKKLWQKEPLRWQIGENSAKPHLSMQGRFTWIWHRKQFP